MDSDKDDLAALCEGMTRDQVDRVHRLLHEWSVGPENSFPVQLSLLTRAQLRAAASVPCLVNDARKLMELHLAKYQQQTAELVKNLSAAAEDSAAELRSIVKSHAETVTKASGSIREQLGEAEAAARRIKARLDDGIGEWKKARDDFAGEQLKLEKERKELARRIQLRDWFWAGFVLFGAVGLGMLLQYRLQH